MEMRGLDLAEISLGTVERWGTTSFKNVFFRFLALLSKQFRGLYSFGLKRARFVN